MAEQPLSIIHMDTTIIRMETCERMSKAMVLASMTATTLADRSGIPYTTLWRKLKGSAAFTIDEVFVIANVLHVPAASLLPRLFENAAVDVVEVAA